MKNNNCLLNLLKLICLLQDNSLNDSFPSNCEKQFLGPQLNNCYDTRVISLYQKNGSLFSININNNMYSYFRVMSIEDNCCKLLVLNNDYSSTSQFITIHINCIAAIRCIQDIKLF